jgi:uncharacterized membrane protein
MTWSVAFRLRRYLRESLWVIPLLGGVLGWALGLASADLSSIAELSARWEYSAATAEAVLAAVVAASVGLVGFVVTVSVLIVQISTNTFSARYMRIFYRDRAFKAVLAELIGTFTFLVHARTPHRGRRRTEPRRDRCGTCLGSGSSCS